MILKKRTHEYIEQYLLLLFVFSMLFSIQVNSIFIILLTVNFILEGGFKDKWIKIKNQKIVFLFISLYFIHIIGALYSNNLNVSLGKLERISSILIFPLILSVRSPFEKDKFITVLKTFVVSCAVAGLVCLSYALYRYIETREIENFFYHNLGKGIGIHAIYFSMYLLLSIVILFYLLKQSSQRRAVYIAGILFLSIILILLASKTVIFIYFIIINCWIIISFLKRVGVKKVFIIILMVNFIVLSSMYSSSYIRGRFLEIYNSNMEVIGQDHYQYDTAVTGFTLRVIFWKSVINILNEKNAWLFGVGIGDGQDLLNEQYLKMNLYTGNKNLGDSGYWNYDAHNQYMDIFLKLGLVGLFCFVIVLISPLKYLNRRNFYLYGSFSLIIVITSLTESILGLQKGIVYYSFFNSFLFFNLSNTKSI